MRGSGPRERKGLILKALPDEAAQSSSGVTPTGSKPETNAPKG